MSINAVAISGNLTRDAEKRATASGYTVLTFSIAVNSREKDPATGDWRDVPNFIECSLFGKRADGLASYLTKGTKVAVTGQLRQSRWEDREGRKRSAISVRVDNIDICSRGSQAPAPAPAPAAPAPSAGVYADADIPF